MGFMNKVKDLLGQHGDKVGQGLDKAAEAVDSKTGGKYSDQIKTGTEKAKDAMGTPRDDSDTKGETRPAKENRTTEEKDGGRDKGDRGDAS